MQQWNPVICAWMADFFENIHLHSIKQPHSSPCKALKSSFGEGNSSLRQAKDYWLYYWMIILTSEGDEIERWKTRQYQEDWAVAILEGIFWIMKCISQATIMVPDTVHTVYHCIIKHLMDWIMCLLQHHSRIDKFNQHWVMIPPYPGFARLSKPYSQGTQWSGKEMKAHGCVIVPVLVANLSNPLVRQRNPFTEALFWVKNVVRFHHMVQYW